MSAFGAFGGFGQNNNNQQQQSSGFGGFGTNNNNTTSAFGATNTTGFGATNNTTGGGMFGGGSTTGGFGNSGGFGATQTSGFGAKPGGFGSTATTSGGSLFGGGTTTAGSSGFGGFGSTNTAATTTGFGGSSGGLFANKPSTGFGSNTTNSSGPFGSGTTTSAFGGGFGAGAPPSTALGGNIGECQGTGQTPFQPFVEKEPNSTSNQSNSFQSISFQQPYQKFSPEELRLADYTQGRRYGNQSGQAGAFGANTNFGGFGPSQPATTGFGTTNNTNTGSLFGGGTSSGFGTSQPQSTGFGANTSTSGSLFGAAKPATNNLFGGQPQASASGGLFGSSNPTGFGATTGGFGTTNNNNTSGGVFGGNNNPAAKPSFNFGNTPASSGTGFGATPAATGFGGGLFNNNTMNTASSAFGGQQQAQQPAASNPFGGGGGFGTNTQQQPASSLFGGTQQKPATTSLFGQTQPAAPTGLFGATQPAATNNPFGAPNNNQPLGGLFGGVKPAATGTGLFSQPAQNNTGTGLFGTAFGTQNQNQPQPQQNAGGLFGMGVNNQAKPSLFGGAQQQPALGSGLFGNTGNQQQSSLFGGINQPATQQQQPQNSLFGGSSLFGGAQQTQNQTQNQGLAQQSLTTSINDPSAYGQSLFSGLASVQNNNPGPLATPLSNAKVKKTAAALPIYKLNPASSSRFSTPKRGGFGFSYSNYNTPGSVSSSASTPGGNLNGSLLGGSFGRGLSKSMSTSSLRQSFTTEDSILAPGAFSASPSARHYGSTGSMKKLVINRSLRGDLFSPPAQQPQQQPPSTPNSGILKKRVSFDASTTSGAPSGTSSPLKQVQGAAPSSEDLGYMRPQPRNGASTNGATVAPEMEQVRNNELAIVPEEEAAAPAVSGQSSQLVPLQDQEPGEYWMRPSREELDKMTRDQRSKVEGFTVGREGVGQVTFDREVDLTKIDLDSIFESLVLFVVRSCTVYPIASDKPPVGKGLNVPSTISLLNSWPRGKEKRTDKSGTQLNKHINRLKKVANTHFVKYDENTGTWVFTVDHFTTYKLDLEDDETDGEGMSEFGQSTLSAPPDSPTPKSRTPKTQNLDDSFASTQMTHTESDPEDTFNFRKKKKVILPGAFDDEDLYDDDEGMEDASFEQEQQSFLDKRSVGSQSDDGVEEPMEQDDLYDDESVSFVDQEMAGSFPQANDTAELGDDSQVDEDMEQVEETPGGFTRARLLALKNSPTKRKFTAGNDWAATLQTTISPRKQDRALLKSLINNHGNDSQPDAAPTPLPKNRVVSEGHGFATSIDLMNSLFGQARSPTKVAKVPAQSKGFEWPYSKRPKTADNESSSMADTERAFHDSMKPSWGPDGTLVYAVSSSAKPYGRSSRRARERDGLLTIQKGGVVSESRDVRFAKFSNEASAGALKNQIAMTMVDETKGAPFATLPDDFSFSDFFNDQNAKDPAVAHEKLVWELASILFDRIVVPDELRDVTNIVERLRKEKMSGFWEKLVDQASSRQVAMLKSNEEKAIASLSGHRISDACGHLLTGKDFHLATLVAQIGGKDSMRKDIREQLSEWQKSKILPEFNPAIRALYEILSGNVSVCDGTKVAPIEDRIDSFVISKRFGLDWRQAFGLRLWYGISSGDEIHAAVERFEHDLTQDLESSRPHAWYVEQKIPTLWEDKALEDREDLLWGLLRLYAFQDADLDAIIRPENSQLSPLDTRLSWQLGRALTSSGQIHYNGDAADKADQATLSFASQLINEGSWLDAVFVLLHISSATARTKSIQDHLAHHAGYIGSEDSQSFVTLTQAFKIPAPWIWEAKALHMRSVKKDPRGEVDCLVKAGSFEEAHRTFTRDVAPKTVIERDYDTLRTLLTGFYGKEIIISEWHLGGEIYSDYLQLLDSQKRARDVDYAVIDRLLASLPAVVEETRHAGFMETVAVETMSGDVAKAVADMGQKGDKGDLPKILKLPLTEDHYLKHTVELSLGYYRTVMAGGR